MTPDKLRALADALEPMAKAPRFEDFDVPAFCAWVRAQADAQPVAAVPAGYKLVPVEPTPEMLSAVGMMDGYDWHAPGCSPDADHANWYSAMIAAAPAAPQAEPKRDQSMLDLLAVIHCDGGHHTEAVGIDQSIKDAQAAVCELKGKLAQAEPKREPLSDERIELPDYLRLQIAGTAAAHDVLAERRRQIEAEGWTTEHDDEHDGGALALAAAAYALDAGDKCSPYSQGDGGGEAPEFWPWTHGSGRHREARWWKPSTPRRNLVKAGALILAEIERLDRMGGSDAE